MAERARELALFNLGIDGKLTACDLTALRVRGICHSGQVSSRAIASQRKTKRAVRGAARTADPFRSARPVSAVLEFRRRSDGSLGAVNHWATSDDPARIRHSLRVISKVRSLALYHSSTPRKRMPSFFMTATEAMFSG